ncbi:MAG: hypothetical protein AB1938_26250 [Myxococcota bacterium]
MGLFDSVKRAVSSVLPKVELPKPSLPNPSALVKTGASVAKDVFQAATKPAVDLASSVIPSRAGVSQVAHSWYDKLNSVADTFGGGLRKGGALLEAGGQALSPFFPGANELTTIGRAAQVSGRAIADAPENAVQVAQLARREVDDLYKRGVSLFEDAKKTIGAGIDAARRGLEQVGQGLDTLKRVADEYSAGVLAAVDYKTNIDKLGEGDKYKLGVGGSGSIEGGKLYAKGSIEVSREKDGYTVAVDGELGGGLYGQLGVAVGGKVSIDGQATLGVGGKVEFKFKTAEEAKRATEILLKQAAASAAGAAMSSTPVGPLGAVAGQVAQRTLGPSAADLQFLSQRMSAVELKGNVAAEAAATLGFKDALGAAAGVKGKAEYTVRLDFNRKDDAGRPLPPQASVKQSLTLEGGAGGGVAVGNGKEGNQKNDFGLPYLGGKVELKAEVEQRFTLPSSIDGAKLQSDPLGTLSAIRDQVARSEEQKVTISVDGQAAAVGKGGGLVAEMSFSGKVEDLLNSGYAERLAKGDLQGALRALGDKTQVEAKVTPYAQFGVAMSPSLTVMGFGVGMELEATRKDALDPNKVPRFSGSASQVWDNLSRELQKYAPYVTTGLPPQIRG